MPIQNSDTPFQKSPESGQALVEYALIAVLVALAFGFALAATGPALGNVFSNSIDDLLRQTEIANEDIPGREGFWETVTHAFENPPQERGLPTNTPAPPTTEPTAGPSPTPTNTVATNTPMPSRTPRPTATQVDIIHNAPFYDSIDQPLLWRADPNINLLGRPWEADFYNGTNTTITTNTRVNPARVTGIWTVDFNTAPLYTSPSGTPQNSTNFSASFSRYIELSERRSIAVRVLTTGRIRILARSGTNPPTELLTWSSAGGAERWYYASVVLDPIANPEYHELIVEYIHTTGPVRLLALVHAAGANPDDTYIDGGGNASTAQAFGCNWGRNDYINGNNANTETMMWDEFFDDTSEDNRLPTSSRCYLELRGGVQIPTTAVTPQLVFWSVWDLKTGAEAWLEVSQYVRVSGGGTIPIPDRGAMSLLWRRVNVGITANSRNYNWTRHVVDLRSVTLSNGAAIDFNQPVTFRLVIENRGASNSVNRWYVDDVEVRDAGAARVFTMNEPIFTMDRDEDLLSFIRTGGRSNNGLISGWHLVSNNKFGAGGRSLHESVGPSDPTDSVAEVGRYTEYKRHTQAPTSSDNRDVRVHYVEFNGFVDLTQANTADVLGNTGPIALSFYHAYDLGRNTGLAVQYTTDAYSVAVPTWTDLPEGRLRAVDASNTITNITMQEHVIPLATLPASGINRIRIRFAMFVRTDADRRDGWWIDQIRLGREESPQWIDYPYYDNAQRFVTGPWRYRGNWAQTNETGRPNFDEPTDAGYRRQSYSSSPRGNYTPNQKTDMLLRFPLDVFNDTSTKTVFEKTTNPTQNTGGDMRAAANPILSFYHTRDLASGDDFYVEWKRVSEPDTDTNWRRLWIYKSGMSTDPTVTNAETRRQLGWERVQIPLAPMIATLVAANDATLTDDDVVFRFVLHGKSINSGSGIYIDDIAVENGPNFAADPVDFQLWVGSRTNPIGGGALPTGNGAALFDDPDASSTNRSWDRSWFNGGHWMAVDYEARSGTSSFHDSPTGTQFRDENAEAPNAVTFGGTVNIGEPGWFTINDSFSVLELNNVIDLRATNRETEAPVLRWWHRYHIGNGTTIAVQISTEDTVETETQFRTRCRLVSGETTTDCYEQRRGWSRWNTVWSVTTASNREARAYGWEREQINLNDYAPDPSSNTPGRRIRVRFVYNTLIGGSNQFDGWYLDRISVQHSLPPTVDPVVLRNVASWSAPIDRLLGWVTEGSWGLDPNIYIGTGGSPVTFGVWNVRWFDCSWFDCSGRNSAARCGGSSFNITNVGNFFNNESNWTQFEYQQTVTGLRYNLGNGAPPGAPTGAFRFSGSDAIEFGAVATLDTPVIDPANGFPAGNRALFLTSDDGSRAWFYEIDAGGNRVGAKSNIVNQWQNQAPTLAVGPMFFDLGKRYRIEVHYFEGSGGAVLLAEIGEGRYSFSDSPRYGGVSVPDAQPLSYDLRGLSSPTVVYLEYLTQYRFSSSTNAVFEVSTDGGFTWRTDGLGNDIGSVNMDGASFSDGTQPSIGPGSPGANNSWNTRRHNLTEYLGAQLTFRFRYDRQNVSCLRTRGDSISNSTRCEPLSGTPSNGFYDGWWIGSVVIYRQ
ncbi:MAG: hypothetical protein MUF87_14945 [Anaerolineae bacterium]|nr:hypothetical protein [Anaerolineae bacterium]